MDTKKFIAIILFAMGSTTFAIMGLVGVFVYDRTILGYPPLPQDTTQVVALPPPPIPLDKTPVAETMEISQEQFLKLEQELLSKAKIRQERDSLKNYTKKLLDSLTNINQLNKSFSDSISTVHGFLDSSKKQNLALADSIGDAMNIIKKDSAKIEQRNKKISDLEDFLMSKSDTLENKNFEVFAKMYNNTNPNDVAKILEQIDERDAAAILKLMSKKKAGKVLEAMKPENAAAILLLGSGNS